MARHISFPLTCPSYDFSGPHIVSNPIGAALACQKSVRGKLSRHASKGPGSQIGPTHTYLGGGAGRESSWPRFVFLQHHLDRVLCASPHGWANTRMCCHGEAIRMERWPSAMMFLSNVVEPFHLTSTKREVYAWCLGSAPGSFCREVQSGTWKQLTPASRFCSIPIRSPLCEPET